MERNFKLLENFKSARWWNKTECFKFGVWELHLESLWIWVWCWRIAVMQHYSWIAILQLFEYGTLLQKRHYQGWKNPCRYRNIFPTTQEFLPHAGKVLASWVCSMMSLLMLVLLVPMPEKYSVSWSETFYFPLCRNSCPVPEERPFKFPNAGKGWSLERAPPLHYFFVGKFVETQLFRMLNLAPHGRNFFRSIESFVRRPLVWIEKRRIWCD